MAHVPTRHTGLGKGGLGAQPSIFESALDRLAETLDQVAPSARGELIHQFMLRNGFFDDPERASMLYGSIPEIDAYLDQLRISRVTADTNRGLNGEQVMATTIGFGLGLGVAYLVGIGTGPSTSQQRRLEER